MTRIAHRSRTNKNCAQIKQIAHEQYISRTCCAQKIQIVRNIPRGTCPADDRRRPDSSNFLVYQWIYLTKIKLRPRYAWRDQDQELQVCTCGKHTTEMLHHEKNMIIVDFHFHF